MKRSMFKLIKNFLGYVFSRKMKMKIKRKKNTQFVLGGFPRYIYLRKED